MVGRVGKCALLPALPTLPAPPAYLRFLLSVTDGEVVLPFHQRHVRPQQLLDLIGIVGGGAPEVGIHGLARRAMRD